MIFKGFTSLYLCIHHACTLYTEYVETTTPEMYREVQEALKKGYILTSMTTCLASGAPGVGKTRCRCCIFNEIPPAHRRSTACLELVEQSIMVYEDKRGCTDCKVLDSNKMALEVMGMVQSSLSQPGMTEGLEKVAKSDLPSRQLKEVHWVHFLDTGGPREFLDIFPAYIRNVQVLMAFFKLSEKLSDIPITDGCRSYQNLSYFTETNLDYLLKIAQLSLYHRIVHPSTDEQSAMDYPKVMVVGTHGDQVNEQENMEAKNTILKETLHPIVHDEDVISRSSAEMIFPMDNTKAGTVAANQIAFELRSAIVRHATKLTFKLPTLWYLLKLEIQKEMKGHISLDMSKCWRVAQKLQYQSQGALHTALHYLDKVNLLYYEPQVFDGVINPKPVVEILTKLYERHAQLHEKVEADVEDDSDMQFRNQAIFSKAIVQSLWNKDIAPDDIFMDFTESKLTVARVRVPFVDSEMYFMPSLLRLSPTVNEMKDIFLDVSHAIFIAFPGDWAPFSLFCALIVRLLSSCEGGPGWQLGFSGEASHFEPLHKNELELTISDHPNCSVTLINTFRYYVVLPSSTLPQGLLPQVRQVIQQALEHACSTLSYRCLHQFAFPCNCGSDTPDHLATLNIEEETVYCSRDSHKKARLSPTQILWLHPANTTKTAKGMYSSVGT